MVSSCLQKKMALHRNLVLLRSLTNSKSHCRTSILLDALDYIQELKSSIEKLKNEHRNPNQQQQIAVPTEVTVERAEMGFLARVTCEKSNNLLVSILEAFEELDLNVLQAKLSCKDCFWMEALVHGEKLDCQMVKQTLLQTINTVLERSVSEAAINQTES